jgi:hypothetical protein
MYGVKDCEEFYKGETFSGLARVHLDASKDKVAQKILQDISNASLSMLTY